MTTQLFRVLPLKKAIGIIFPQLRQFEGQVVRLLDFVKFGGLDDDRLGLPRRRETRGKATRIVRRLGHQLILLTLKNNRRADVLFHPLVRIAVAYLEF